MTMPKRLLIVDDDESVNSSLRRYFEECDFEVTTAEDATTALELLADRSFDAGIIDLRLPDMSGDALILAAHDMRPEMRCLIYTGSAIFCVSGDLERIGMRADHVVHKPVNDLRVLKDKIDALTEGE